MKGWVILGAGGHGRVVRDALGARPAAFSEREAGARVDGVPVVSDAALEKAGPRGLKLANGLGARADVSARAALYARFKSRGFRFPPVVADSAVVSPTATLAEGSQVLTRAVVHPGAALGEDCVVNTGAVVEHDAVVGAHAFLGPRAVLCGGARVGARAFVGAGAVILPEVKVGEAAVVGAGAVVVRDVPAGARVAGVPARSLR